MDDIMDKIQSILSDKESMEQLNQLAQMFGNQPQSEQQAQPAQPQPAQTQTSMPDLSALVNAFSSQQTPNNEPQQTASASSAGFDIGKLMAVQSLMAKAQQPDKNRDFLIALKPLLKEENQHKIDRLITIFKLLAILPAVKESGLLGGDLLGIL